ncbi:MAG: FtsX-like permease family protein [Polyangiaceae bacterium]
MSLYSLAARNVLRNKTRFGLTVLGLSVAVLIFTTFQTALGSWAAAASFARKDRMVTRHKVTFILSLPKRYVEETRNAKGEDGQPLVAEATYASWFGGRDPKHDRDFFASVAVDPATYFTVYDEADLDPDALKRFQTDRNAAVVGSRLAEKFGWGVGDSVTLDSPIYPAPEGRPWTFTIVGIYTTRDKAQDQSFILSWDRLNDSLPPDQQNQVGWIASKTRDGKDAATVGAALDKLFEDREAATLTQDELAFMTGFMGMVSAVLDVVSVLAVVILAILGLTLANAIAMSVRERTHEYAALKAIGFRPHHVAQLILAEGAVLAAVGALVGTAVAVVLVNYGLGAFFEANLSSFFPVFRVEFRTACAATGVVMLVALLACIVPAWAAARAPVTESLRRVA